MTLAVRSRSEAGSVFMRRALHLARRGLGAVSPNPMVGCLLVKEGRVLSEGWHKGYGQAHAEAEALALGGGQDLRGAKLYVTLEPCAHTGKTPPCTRLILDSGVRHVVVAHQDPNPLVSGKGIQRLKDAGIEVSVGMCEAASKHLNRRFLTFFQKQRPYIILKWTQTPQGYLSPWPRQRLRLSHPYATLLIHQWRSQEDALWIGYRTAEIDQPQLNTRHIQGKDPVRILWDREDSLPKEHPLRKNPDGKTLRYTGRMRFPQDILSDLYARKIQSVLVEGGSATLEAFISAKLWDEARVFTVPKSLDKGLAAPQLRGQRVAEERIGTDMLHLWYPET